MNLFFPDKPSARNYCKTSLREFYSRKSSSAETVFPELSNLADRLKKSGITKALAYKALSNEAPVTDFLLSAGFSVYIPEVLPENQMEFLLIGGTDRGPVADPVLKLAAFKSQPDSFLVIIPSLGVHRDGHRLGRGGGYYDRWKDALSDCLKAGVLPQRVTNLDFPVKNHDLRFDLVITENGILDFNSLNSDIIPKTH